LYRKDQLQYNNDWTDDRISVIRIATRRLENVVKQVNDKKFCHNMCGISQLAMQDNLIRSNFVIENLLRDELQDERHQLTVGQRVNQQELLLLKRRRFTRHVRVLQQQQTLNQRAMLWNHLLTYLLTYFHLFTTY